MINLPKETKISQTGQILKYLKEHGSMTNTDMWNRRIQRGSERIRELKSEGHIIVSNHVEGPLWEYIYKGHVDNTIEEKKKRWWKK